jgi:hypothetical protein
VNLHIGDGTGIGLGHAICGSGNTCGGIGEGLQESGAELGRVSFGEIVYTFEGLDELEDATFAEDIGCSGTTCEGASRPGKLPQHPYPIGSEIGDGLQSCFSIHAKGFEGGSGFNDLLKGGGSAGSDLPELGKGSGSGLGGAVEGGEAELELFDFGSGLDDGVSDSLDHGGDGGNTLGEETKLHHA